MTFQKNRRNRLEVSRCLKGNSSFVWALLSYEKMLEKDVNNKKGVPKKSKHLFCFLRYEEIVVHCTISNAVFICEYVNCPGAVALP